MAKFQDYYVAPDVAEIMEEVIDAFPQVFQGFDVNKVGVVFTRKKKNRKVLRLSTVGYPRDLWCDKVYIVEVFDAVWQKLDDKRKNLAVFHIMCSVPSGGFDEASNFYGKRRRPDIEMYMEEFSVCGGVPNWVENDAALDPLEENNSDKEEIERNPVTANDIANLGSLDEEDEEEELEEEVA